MGGICSSDVSPVSDGIIARINGDETLDVAHCGGTLACVNVVPGEMGFSARCRAWIPQIFHSSNDATSVQVGVTSDQVGVSGISLPWNGELQLPLFVDENPSSRILCRFRP